MVLIYHTVVLAMWPSYLFDTVQLIITSKARFSFLALETLKGDVFAKHSLAFFPYRVWVSAFDIHVGLQCDTKAMRNVSSKSSRHVWMSVTTSGFGRKVIYFSLFYEDFWGSWTCCSKTSMMEPIFIKCKQQSWSKNITDVKAVKYSEGKNLAYQTEHCETFV